MYLGFIFCSFIIFVVVYIYIFTVVLLCPLVLSVYVILYVCLFVCLSWLYVPFYVTGLLFIVVNRFQEQNSKI